MAIGLDLKDRKILSELDFNARASNTHIAKKVLLSKKGVEYRIRQLEKKGIILGYYPLVNFTKLGHLYCRVFIRLQHMNKNAKKQIESYIKFNKYINWAIWARGDYDIVFGVWARSLKMYKNVLDEFYFKFGKHTLTKVASLATELDHYPYAFLLEKKSNKGIILKEEKNTREIDLLDIAILQELSKNARQSSSEIARKISSNYKTVLNRINRMSRDKILLGTRAIIDHQKLGYTHYKVLITYTKADKEALVKIKEYLKSDLSVIYLVEDVGLTGLDVELMVSSNREFFEFLDKLQNKFPNIVKSYEYMIYTDTIKVSYLPHM